MVTTILVKADGTIYSSVVVWVKGLYSVPDSNTGKYFGDNGDINFAYIW